MIRFVSPENISSEADKPYTLFETELSGNKYRMEYTPIGNFKMCYDDDSLSSFERKLPPIPSKFHIVCMFFFKEICKRYNTEAALQLFYNEEKGYFLHLPEQVVRHASVDFERDYMLEANNLLVADIHSHGIIPAFFSSIDDRDELGTRLFIVYGDLLKKPAFRLRAGSGGHFKNIELFDVFDTQDEVILSEVNAIINELLKNAHRIKF